MTQTLGKHIVHIQTIATFARAARRRDWDAKTPGAEGSEFLTLPRERILSGSTYEQKEPTHLMFLKIKLW